MFVASVTHAYRYKLIFVPRFVHTGITSNHAYSFEQSGHQILSSHSRSIWPLARLSPDLSSPFSHPIMALPLQNLSSLSPEDRILFQSYGQGPKIPAPFSLVHKAIEHIVDANITTVAVEHSGRFITYGELDRDANILSNRLIAMGLRPRQRVCLVYQRSIPMVIAILAVLKCGCQYVPMDGGVVSDESLLHILKDTNAPIVLCLEKYYQRCKQFSPQDTFVVALEDLLDNSNERVSDRRPQIEISPEDGAYVIYTSG